ncbi:diguanylate cyclase domain-containing protein [Zoogloea sp.]|uniref:diguanylate cyclase domain-containing protein n=1 Tax=Zoogloea sp. TaxID=49181 RepID=UPI0035B3039D
MSIPVSALLGSTRRFVSAIVLFVLLDLTVLVINLWLADQLADDAVAINLAGRQRMLSQQTTKALLLANGAADPATRAAAADELATAFGLFEQTLTAFAESGQTLGGDDTPVTLKAVTGEAARAVREARAIVAPLKAMLHGATPASRDGPHYAAAADYMVRHNREVLSLMNSLTTALEHDSVRRSRDLRAIQTGAFVLALGNFLAIVVGLLRQFRATETDRQRWRELARHDPLTGLANRKAFTETALGVLARAEVDGSCGAVLMLDLDGFKPINDSFGHATGDRILIALAASLDATARATDTAARLGGDEFAILCPNLHEPAHIDQFCGRLLAAIARIPDEICPGRMLGASIGVAVYPDNGYALANLMGQADRAMYAAKHSGGNRWQAA